MPADRIWIKNPLALFTANDTHAPGGLVVENGVIVEMLAAGASPAQPVSETFDAREHVVLPGLVNTHHHFDHSMANPKLAERYSAPVFGHASDDGRLPGLTDGLEEGDTVSIGNQSARVLFIPAHTKGHIAYVFDDARAIFCGDTLFAAGCGRLFEGTPEMMYTALVEKLGALPDDYRVFCGHEYTESNLAFAAHVDPDNSAVLEKRKRVQQIRKGAAADWHDATPAEMTIPTTIGEERATNPFMRAKDAAELGRIRAEKDSF